MPNLRFLSYFFAWTQYKQLVTDGNTNICCRGFVLASFQSTTAYIIYSEHIQDYTKLYPIYKVEILQVTVNKIDVLSFL